MFIQGFLKLNLEIPFLTHLIKNDGKETTTIHRP